MSASHMSLAHDHPLRPTLSNTMSATGSTGSSTWTSSDSTVTPEIFPAHLLVPPSQRRNGAIIRSQTLTDDQRANIALLESHFMGRRYMLPIYEGSKDRAPLSEREMMFLSRECFLKFLTATRQGAKATAERIEKTLIWRRTARMDEIDAEMEEDMREETMMGKNLVLGFTARGEPVVYFFPTRNTKQMEVKRTMHALFMMERALDLMADGVSTILLVVKFEGRGAAPISPGAMKHLLNLFAAHHPYMMGRCVLLEMPGVMRMFMRVIWPFIESATRDKMRFYQGKETIPESEVTHDNFLKDCGGKLDLPFDYDTYWPALMEACRARRADQALRWRALGPPRVGREERLFKVAPRAMDSSASPKATHKFKTPVTHSVRRKPPPVY